MKSTRKIICLVLLGLLCSLNNFTTAKELEISNRNSPLPSTSKFIAVNFNDYANEKIDLNFETSKITVGEIPFDLISSEKFNALSLKNVGWKDWQVDPSKFLAKYDSVSECNDPNRVIVQVPVADYSAIYLLAVTDNDSNYSQTVTFRIGAIEGGHGQVTYNDFAATIPRANEKEGGIGTVSIAGERLFLVRLPLKKAIAQDFKKRITLDVDITKELHLAIHQPDPCRFNLRPLGLPSGVRIVAITFERSPITMEVSTIEPAHIFNVPAVPAFQITLQNTASYARKISCSLEAKATDYYGNEILVSKSDITASYTNPVCITLDIPVKKLGYHELEITLKSNNNDVLLTRKTTFALLPKDTRKYRYESPLGTAEYKGGDHYTTINHDFVGPLYVKAGLLYGMPGYDQEFRSKYGIINKIDPKPDPSKDMGPDANGVIKLADEIQKNPELKAPPRFLIFHEHTISGKNVTRVPDIFTGREYIFDKEEAKKFQDMWDYAEKTCKDLRKYFPNSEIYFGNGNPQLLEEFLKRKFPPELLGSRGNEAMSGMRLPETQPLDFIANNSGLWMDRMILDGYGYKDTPLRQCAEVCYPGTNTGNLTLNTQANYYVRHIMHSLAWRIPIIRPGLLFDAGNSYYYSNWGSSGFCFGLPEISPKPSYVAIATLTSVLDGASYIQPIETGSFVVYALEFKRKDGMYATCMWTIKGKRPIEVGFAKNAKVSLTDIMGNEEKLACKNKKVWVTISDSPVFLTTKTPIKKINLKAPKYESEKPDNSHIITAIDKLADWQIENTANIEIETYNFLEPRRLGNFTFEEKREFEGEKDCIMVRPNLPVPGSEYLSMYTVLEHNNDLEIPGEPTQIGLLVNGNGGWGRFIFELEDASGQRWISIGCSQSKPTDWMADWMSKEEFEKLKENNNVCAWNTNDAWKRSYINFEGWKQLWFPLPGNYLGEKYHWPSGSQWRYSGDGVVKYPLKVKKLIITIPQNILYLTEYQPVPRQEIYFKNLMVMYGSPEDIIE